MSSARRYLSMVLGAVSLVLLGFVVTVAAGSRPGGSGDEALLDTNLRFDIDATRILAWVIVVMAVVGVVLLALGVKEAKPRPEKKKRSFWVMVAGAVAFFLIIKYIQPLAAGLLESPDVVESSGEGPDAIAPSSGSNSAWLFTVLLAAILVAALTRVGLTVRSSDGSFDLPTTDGSGPAPWAFESRPRLIALGQDPRSRILNAYSQFEQTAAVRQVGRRGTETAGAHARRVIEDLGIDSAKTLQLMSLFSLTRFGVGEVTDAQADQAEKLTGDLDDEMQQ